MRCRLALKINPLFPVFLIFLVFGFVPAIPSGNLWAVDLKPKSRMDIMRGLIAEYATLKTPLPRGEKGLFVKADGQIEQENLKKEITAEGTALQPNVLIQITDIVFRDKEIAFEINGGGRKKKKWFEHIEVGTGYGTTPVSRGDNQGAPTGSTITLVFPKKLQDMSVDELKEHLLPVLDFTPVTPMQAITAPVPPEFQSAIEEKRAAEGMDRDMVIAALGQPDRKVRETDRGVEQEDWIYGTPPLRTVFVRFEDDVVVSVEEYSGGVTGEALPPIITDPRDSR
jgi:hypothetical protein